MSSAPSPSVPEDISLLHNTDGTAVSNLSPDETSSAESPGAVARWVAAAMTSNRIVQDEDEDEDETIIDNESRTDTRTSMEGNHTITLFHWNTTTSFRLRRFLGVMTISCLLAWVSSRVATFPGAVVPPRTSMPTVHVHFPPRAKRITDVQFCANHISGSQLASDDVPRRAAIQWFLSGAGRNINVTSTNCLLWNSSFAILYSLIVTRESLKVPDPSWYSNKSIFLPSQACRWVRVQCTTSGTVKGLVFNNAGITGTLPPELMTLTTLQRLEIITNSGLHGPIPTEIGQLSQLGHLLLQETSLSGPIPTEIGNLTALQQFLLDHTLLNGTMPKQVCQLVQKGSLQSLRNTCASAGADPPLLSCSCCTSCKRPGSHVQLMNK